MLTLGDYIDCLGDYVTGWSGPRSLPIAAAVCDSRVAGPGQLFCAMRGEARDGHDFIGEALSRGASAVLCERPDCVPAGTPFIAIHDAYPAFGLAAELSWGRPADSMRLVGVTGTNGKTTTAYLLRAILRQAGRKTAMVGTVEYDLGDGHPLVADRTTPTPFALQEMLHAMRDHGVQDAVLEVSSHALAQKRLGRARFGAAVFTNLTRDHFDYHHDFENYYACKKRLFAEMLADDVRPVINVTGEWGRRLARELTGIGRRCTTFSADMETAADYHLENLRQDMEGTSFRLAGQGGGLAVSSPLTGRYNAENLAGAALAALGLGVPPEAVQKALAECAGAPGRLERVGGATSGFAVYVDYAHTDDAIRKALAALRAICRGRLAIVFGCGGNRDRAKRPMMAAAACELADDVYVTSDNPRFEEPEAIIADILAGIPEGRRVVVEPDRRLAIGRALAERQPGDVVLVAGKGHEDYQEIRGVKHHFNDVEEVRRFLS